MQGGRKRYEGAWRRGRRQGQGTEWYPSGEQYSGARLVPQGTPMQDAAGCLALSLLDIEQTLPALHGMPSGKWEVVEQMLCDVHNVLGLFSMASTVARL